MGGSRCRRCTGCSRAGELSETRGHRRDGWCSISALQVPSGNPAARSRCPHLHQRASHDCVRRYDASQPCRVGVSAGGGGVCFRGCGRDDGAFRGQQHHILRRAALGKGGHHRRNKRVVWGRRLARQHKGCRAAAVEACVGKGGRAEGETGPLGKASDRTGRLPCTADDESAPWEAGGLWLLAGCCFPAHPWGRPSPQPSTPAHLPRRR